MNKKLLLLIPVAGVIGLSLLSTSTSKVEKYHKDGIEALNFSSNPNLGLTGGRPWRRKLYTMPHRC